MKKKASNSNNFVLLRAVVLCTLIITCVNALMALDPRVEWRLVAVGVCTIPLWAWFYHVFEKMKRKWLPPITIGSSFLGSLAGMYLRALGVPPFIFIVALVCLSIVTFILPFRRKLPIWARALLRRLFPRFWMAVHERRRRELERRLTATRAEDERLSHALAELDAEGSKGAYRRRVASNIEEAAAPLADTEDEDVAQLQPRRSTRTL